MSKRNRANFRNAQLSTGPRTDAGKKSSSLNALRHGLSSQVVVLPTEDLDAYVAFAAAFHSDLDPVNVVEKQLVQTLADTQWRLNRCAALESNLYSVALADAAALVANARAEQNLEAMEIAESFKLEYVETPEPVDPAPQITAALNSARAFRDNAAAIRTLGIHEQRLQRTFHQTFKLLQTLQSQRKADDRENLKNAALLLQANKQKGLPYNPADDGFDCSTAQIELYIGCQARVKEAQNAALIGFNPQSPQPLQVD